MTSDYKALAASSDVLGVNVFHDGQLREALLDSGALAAMRPGSVVAVHTTGSPTLARDLAACAPPDVEVADACFSGGPQDTARGELTLMVGGTQRGLERARPMLECYANNIFHMGPVGAGQTAKLLNNLTLATNFFFAAHVIERGVQQGLDGLSLAKVIQKSSGASFSMSLFTMGGQRDNVVANLRPYLVKDVTAAQQAGRTIGLDMALFDPVLAFFEPG